MLLATAHNFPAIVEGEYYIALFSYLFLFITKFGNCSVDNLQLIYFCGHHIILALLLA
jgi:hypothetical protein